MLKIKVYEENIYNVTFYVFKKHFFFFRKVFIDKQLKKTFAIIIIFFKIYESDEKDFEKHFLRIVA